MERLDTRDTLLLVALSGGGSRAAYFDAAVLEKLSRIHVPGRSGQPISLVQRIDLLSTISGGSIAGSYFAVHRPEREDATDAQLSAFFGRFKEAMATDFENDMARDILRPANTLAFILGLRSGAEALADVLDRRFFGGRRFRLMIA